MTISEHRSYIALFFIVSMLLLLLFHLLFLETRLDVLCFLVSPIASHRRPQSIPKKECMNDSLSKVTRKDCRSSVSI